MNTYIGILYKRIVTGCGADLVANFELKFWLEGLELFCWAGLTKWNVAPSNEFLEILLSTAYYARVGNTETE